MRIYSLLRHSASSLDDGDQRPKTKNQTSWMLKEKRRRKRKSPGSRLTWHEHRNRHFSSRHLIYPEFSSCGLWMEIWIWIWVWTWPFHFVFSKSLEFGSFYLFFSQDFILISHSLFLTPCPSVMVSWEEKKVVDVLFVFSLLPVSVFSVYK